jgi:hypothetical protein
MSKRNEPTSKKGPLERGKKASALGKSRLRPLGTPNTTPRAVLQQTTTPEPLSELIVRRPGRVPYRVAVPARNATPELLDKIAESLKSVPRLSVQKGKGAVDIKLEDRAGGHVKEGVVVLEGPKGKSVSLSLDPVSRRFRHSGLAPGTYQVSAQASGAGKAAAKLTLRDEDVTRAVMRLDGSQVKGSGTVRFALRGTKATRVSVRATDVRTGRTVFEQSVAVKQGRVEITKAPFGKLHWQFDDGSAKSCYDADVNSLTAVVPDIQLELVPFLPEPQPDPPDGPFVHLPRDLAGVVSVLPALGIHSTEALAAAEPEGLMHRAAALRSKGIQPVHSRLFARAIETARSRLGLVPVSGEDLATFRLAKGATFSRAFRPREAGEAELEVSLAPGASGQLILEGPRGVEKRSVKGTVRLAFVVEREDVERGAVFHVSLANKSDSGADGMVMSRLPSGGVNAVAVKVPSVKELIEQVLQGVAAQNPGISTTIPDAVLVPENIRMWLDRARTFMLKAGVCSINDLGRLRMVPMPILRPGAYVAPVVQPPNLTLMPALPSYILSEVIDNSVLHYLPNDMDLHKTAFILADEWDIRGEKVVIGKEIRELLIIVRSIKHDINTQITWETPPLPLALSYWPSPAPAGANGSGWGADGADGGDGDQNPHPSKNGGASAVTIGPTVTAYILDTTNNLPRIDLGGQDGGAGGDGQDGGRGGDGHTGLRASGTFFGGCCRGVGWGGNGGRGGRGGTGGTGGSGGEGGRITLLTTAESIAVLAAAPPPIDVKGGTGGPGGFAGNPGGGGQGGHAGTADCETWCDEHPERRGEDGKQGPEGIEGVKGADGPAPVDDAFQLLPITEEQWLQELTNPHIFSLNIYEAEPGELVFIEGQNFDPSIDRVFFDGENVAPVLFGNQASFTVPLTSEGGWHTVLIRSADGPDRRSNKAMLLVIPKLVDISVSRWEENQQVTLSGLAFHSGLTVLAEDRSVDPPHSFSLPVDSVTRTEIQLTIPPAPLGSLRGVRRIVVRNPDNGTSRDEFVARISHTIVVRCAAFRVVGPNPGFEPTLTAAEIAHLFDEGAALGISVPWAQADIVFRLVQPVKTIVAEDDATAYNWPFNPGEGVQSGIDQTFATDSGALPGVLNFFFFNDLEFSTAYAYSAGPIFVGTTEQQADDEEDVFPSPVDIQQIVAHETGHALCLQHVCPNESEDEEDTLFGRECDDGDEDNLMYPYWNESDGMELLPSQIDTARSAATHGEDGKTVNTGGWCGGDDTHN